MLVQELEYVLIAGDVCNVKCGRRKKDKNMIVSHLITQDLKKFYSISNKTSDYKIIKCY